MEHSVQNRGVYSTRQGPDGKKRFALGTLLFWNPDSAGVGTGAQTIPGMGCKVDWTSTTGQFFKLHHSTQRELYVQFFELSKTNAV